MAHLNKLDWVLITLLSAVGIVAAIVSGSVLPVIDTGCFVILLVMGVHSERENRELKETIRTLRDSIKEELK
ncbi:MAG: hypothetical protein Tp138OMZ00d2C19078241_31 [Prokaryotic dsDNA virus sp.]|jgi:hypothetical protein|nr:MAG: hypothetical protein Tp138OMZ00d2C19078241_31 [Prokaryotic dsDNA virus sp.]|tara:strand:- start:40290 stop:40505 length:216 start_codon:yes stop_codon:yes gene_type:complete